jgi:fatty-acyl-CoA synthase
MDGLMMDYQLTIPAFLRRAQTLFGRREIVSRRPDRSLHRYTYAECLGRARKLAAALRALGIRDGDRVATLAWNSGRHLEAYYGIAGSGAVLHTLNLRLHPDELAYIAAHAGDRAVLVDETLLPLLERFHARAPFEHVIVMRDGGDLPDGMLDYEALLAGAGAGGDWPDLAERDAAAMCYTSGTTGRPKGVLYSHRALVLHSLGSALTGTLDVRGDDTVLPVVPMFHANAWGLPFTCLLTGARQVHPGPHLDPASLLELFERERVTITAGVPTIWLGILQALDAAPGARDLSALRVLVVGGAAMPEAAIRAFEERHGLRVLHAWGMTEMAPLGTVAHLPPELRDAPPDDRYAARASQGIPAPLVEIRARGESGALVPWDGTSMGELEVRGPWVARAYYDSPPGDDRFTPDGWFRTGDIVSIDSLGQVRIRDRAKDLIKSGGEWISSVALESALMGHPAVAEAAVVAVPHPRWQERPLAVVSLRPGRLATDSELRAYLEPHFPPWAIPDGVEFVAQIPRTSAGKFDKGALRESYRDWVARREGVAGGVAMPEVGREKPIVGR